MRLTQPSNGRVILHRVVPSDSRVSTTTLRSTSKIIVLRGRRGDAVERTANSVGCAELIIEIVRSPSVPLVPPAVAGRLAHGAQRSLQLTKSMAVQGPIPGRAARRPTPASRRCASLGALSKRRLVFLIPSSFEKLVQASILSNYLGLWAFSAAQAVQLQ